MPGRTADLTSWYDEDGNFGGQGHEVNPFTGEPYEVNMVPRGDYARVIAEFWADGPDSRRLPVTGTPCSTSSSWTAWLVNHRWRGQGPLIDDLRVRCEVVPRPGWGHARLRHFGLECQGLLRLLSSGVCHPIHGRARTKQRSLTCPIITLRVCRSSRVGLKWWTTRIP